MDDEPELTFNTETVAGLWSARVHSGMDHETGALRAVLEIVVPGWDGYTDTDDPAELDRAPRRLVHLDPQQAFILAVQLGALATRQLATEQHDEEAA